MFLLECSLDPCTALLTTFLDARVLCCSWREKAEPDGPLPPFLESSYFQNKRVRLKRGDVVQVKPCEETVRGSGGNVTRYCCSTPNDGCLPAQDSLRLDTRLGQDAHVQFLQVHDRDACPFEMS